MKHEVLEKNSILLLVCILLVVSIGGLVQIAPLFWLDNTIEKVKGMRPYSPLELAGRDIYLREGCYVCHSQMIRTLRDEVERYGHYSLAAESMYDHPFQWGSKRTGPDLARVGGKYSDQWHADHMINPRSLVPESIMPGYPWLAKNTVDTAELGQKLKTLRAQRWPVRYCDDENVEVTARWGWPSVPQAVVDATYIRAAAIVRRKDSPEGVLGGFDGGGAVRVSIFNDPDLVRLLRPYRKHVPGLFGRGGR